MNIIGIIPARYASSRFPGKPLVDIAGKSMIQRVYERCLLSNSLSSAVVATDDDRIADHVKSFGGNVILTSSSHNSGTDRCAEAANHFPDANIIINIQGDEPFIQPEQIDLLAACFNSEGTEIATLVKKIDSYKELFNPNTPKVIIDKTGKALYFSRNTIPFQRDVPENEWLDKQDYFKHIGIYGFRVKTLQQLTLLPISALEKAEALEQLRWLENGYSIQTAKTSYQSYGIDSPDDITLALKEFKDLL
ncbi:3-deoxy-manno-octulosonate cytidylyltransferase [Albibacterium bauzanense]|uniref:3-deoxy-manno-octulosonate cytidylyltransferase n=1 Tax=Albibacterium bauzanense TaxID=653929 RepID=A0A4R1M0F9_9SPHI|nr:3-deoxy-manno-octulosonate cytidylyltransferase [Albibacterium bauzanense]TCK85095.1 3-deoxy-manno-octulosonate cytidylyltransferase (CMP-KDO synthetase) [Albibacterium bauzanense]